MNRMDNFTPVRNQCKLSTQLTCEPDIASTPDKLWTESGAAGTNRGAVCTHHQNGFHPPRLSTNTGKSGTLQNLQAEKNTIESCP